MEKSTPSVSVALSRKCAVGAGMGFLSLISTTDFIIRSTVLDQMTACLLKEITPEDAAQNAMKTINLYLAE